MKRPLRILHVSSGNLYGGVETVLATLARTRHLCATLEQSFALCFEGRIASELCEAGVSPTFLGPVRMRNPWQVFRARLRMRNLLRRERFDAVVCHSVWNLCLFGPTVRRANSPLMFWMHDAATGDHWLERLASSVRPDLAIANSEFTAQTLPKLFRIPPPHRIIYEPVMPPHFSISSADREQLRAEHGTAPNDAVIIQVGRMEPYKGHKLHLDALAQLKELPGWHCWIVGGPQRAHESEYAGRLQQQAEATGIGDRVRFLGDRTDVSRLLAGADIFCQPNTRGEPFGVVFLEALYAGLPVVATAIGGALEIVSEDCGRLTPPGDPAALANTLRQLIEDSPLRTRLGTNGPARATSLSSPDLVLGQLEAAVCDALKCHSRARAQ